MEHPKRRLSDNLPPFPITFADAMARLTSEEMVDCRYEPVICLGEPDPGISFGYRFHRAEVIDFLAGVPHGAIAETGIEGQRLDYGMYVPFEHDTHGLGLLFISTRPEKRLSWSDLVSKEITLTQRCPDCRIGALLEGPRGGATVNVQCDNCGHRFNLAMEGRVVFHTERIDGKDGKPYTAPL